MVDVDTVALIVALDAPLYIAMGTIMWRLGLLRNHGDDVDANEDDIQSIKDSLREIDKRLALLEQDHQMFHDNNREQNHCGHRLCRFCDHDDE